ncbi:hypothetical protein [Mesorhizobium loti]|uniref:hypothetical protein n=1 Tax=Rhizobium loti TaxID=381 RepID=UPI001AEF12CA|nr:hypothetical protein [Mesorhizobium loti]
MLTLDDTLDVILGAVHLANDQYLTMSGNASVLDNGVESLISSTIAKELWIRSNSIKGNIPLNSFSYGQYMVTLESPFHHVSDESGSEKRGKSNQRYTENERVDVTFWSRDGCPLGMVEVKRYFGFAQAETDIERVCDLIKRHGSQHGGSLRWGAIAGMRPVWESTRKQPKEILSEVCSKIEEKYPKVNIRSDFRMQRLKNPMDFDEGLFLGCDAYVVLMTNKRI